MKKRFIKFIFILNLFLFCSTAYASGMFSTGLMMGITGDSGGNSQMIRDINSEMRSVQGATPGTTVTEIEMLYTPVVCINFSYIYNNMIIKFGWEYANDYFLKDTGSIDTPLTPENTIEIEYSRFTFPVSLGLIIPLNRRSRFFFAGGINFSYALLQVSQSDPGVLASFPDAEYSFTAYLMGFHLKAGAEAILSRNYSFIFEFTRFFGNQSIVESDDKNGEVLMGLNTFEFAAGVNYTLDFL